MRVDAGESSMGTVGTVAGALETTSPKSKLL